MFQLHHDNYTLEKIFFLKYVTYLKLFKSEVLLYMYVCSFLQNILAKIITYFNF